MIGIVIIAQNYYIHPIRPWGDYLYLKVVHNSNINKQKAIGNSNFMLLNIIHFSDNKSLNLKVGLC